MTRILTSFLLSFLLLSGATAESPLPINGKGMYLWQLWTSHGGGKNLPTIVAKMKSIGATWIIFKMGDGDSYYNSSGKSLYTWATTNYGSMDSVIGYFHANGIKVLPYQYVYGVPHRYGNPASETDVADQIMSVKGVDGFVIDAEIQYDTLATRTASAKAYCDTLRAKHKGMFMALTAWARVNGHASFPWVAFLSRTDVNMVQTYWAARPVTPASELSTMNTQFTTNTAAWVSAGDSAAKKPIMPIGQGMTFGYGSDVLTGDIASFCSACVSTYHFPGASIWEYNQITHSYVWDEYAAATWPIVNTVRNDGSAPQQFSLAQNFPNPFNPGTMLRYELPAASRVRLTVTDALGRMVATVSEGTESAGAHDVPWNAAGFASGIYFARLTAVPLSGGAAQTSVRKMLLMR